MQEPPKSWTLIQVCCFVLFELKFNDPINSFGHFEPSPREKERAIKDDIEDK